MFITSTRGNILRRVHPAHINCNYYLERNTMKQFLHTSKGNVVVALHNHAFALVYLNDAFTSCELKPSTIEQVDGTEASNKEANSSDSSVQAVSSLLIKDGSSTTT